MESALYLIVDNHGKPTLLGYSGEWPHVIFFNPTDATRVAKSPRLGVGPGFDSQGSVTFFHKYCFPNLHRSHWAIPWWSDSAIYSNIQVHDYNLNRVLVEQKCSFPSSPSHHSWGQQPQKSWWRQQTTTIGDNQAECIWSRPALVTSMVDVQDFGNAV